MSEKPIIGITMRHEIETERFYLGRDYSEVLAVCGALPVHLSLIPEREYIFEILQKLDGILLPGSDSDVDPLRYGQEPQKDLKHVVPLKDQTDLLVLEAAEKCRLPLLGICYGLQVLNVHRGGTLWQDIPANFSDCVKHEQGHHRRRLSHSVQIEKNSKVFAASGVEQKLVNSFHHQAINKIGSNLKAVAWAQDGVIEAIEDTRQNQYVLGVQWHPELSWSTDEFSLNIFKMFVNECSLIKRMKG